MTPDEFKEIRTTLGYTQTELANLLGYTSRQIINYESESEAKKIPLVVELALKSLRPKRKWKTESV